MTPSPLAEFYHDLTACTGADLSTLLPRSIQQDVGHFNVFDLASLYQSTREQPTTPYPCRSFYKISLLRGRSQAEYPDVRLELAQNTLIFSTPKVPHNWLPQDDQLTGLFCVFTAEFLRPTDSGVVLDELPLFRADTHPVFQLSDEQNTRATAILQQMQEEMASDYAYKYDLLRTYVLELIHLGQKLQPATALHPAHSAPARLTSLFVELLERQFPLETPQQQMQLRTANAYAEHLAVHVNHLNKVLKESTGRTTTELISSRITQEAKALLRQTNWTITEIADSLGFADAAHFSNFFKRQMALAPGTYRLQEIV